MSAKIITKKFKIYSLGAILLVFVILGSLFLINRNNQDTLKISQASNRLPDVVTQYPTPIPLT